MVAIDFFHTFVLGVVKSQLEKMFEVMQPVKYAEFLSRMKEEMVRRHSFQVKYYECISLIHAHVNR